MDPVFMKNKYNICNLNYRFIPIEIHRLDINRISPVRRDYVVSLLPSYIEAIDQCSTHTSTSLTTYT